MDYRHTVEKLRRRIDEVGRHIYQQRAPITNWRYHAGALSDGGAPPDEEAKWQAVRSFDELETPFWLRARVRAPQSFDGKPVALFLRMGGHQHALFGTEALVYVDGRLVQGIDAFHQEVLLANEARGGQEYAITLHLFWRPELGSVGVMPHRRLEIRSESAVTELVQIDRDAERLYWDANTAHELAVALDENDITRVNILTVLDEAFNLVDFREPLGEEFLRSLARADELVRAELYRGQGTGLVPRALAVGQTHIDVAWLWPIPVTHEKIGRTFATMLRMMEQYPDYYFFQNQPQVYEYCKRYFPQLYEEVRARIAEGRWEANGGMWLEPDCNVPSGESLVRQLVFGQRYFQEEFGVTSDVLCLMDVFGLPWCLPQLMQGTGMKYFLTTKLSWNQFNRIPYDSFRWRGTDGTEVLVHFVTAKSSGTRTTCNAILNPEVLKSSWDNYQQKAINSEVLFTFGYGDGGGGPSKDMLETSQRIKELDGPVRLRTGTVSGFFRSIEEEMRDKVVPVWDGELYLEFHRGTYTTRGDAKKHNRKSEVLYHSAELFSALASAMLGRPYPREELNSGWKLILLNQMHDILPGTTIAEVDLGSREDYHTIFDTGEAVLGRALEAIASQVDAPSGGLVIFNPLSWERDDLLRARLTGVGEEFHVLDEEGRHAAHQVLRREGDTADVLVQARGVPSCGYTTLTIRSGHEPTGESSVSVSQSVLENRFFKVDLDRQGRMSSIYDKVARRQVLTPGGKGNTFQIFEDKPRDFDAWEIDIYYQEKMREVEGVESVRVVEEGPLRGGVEVRRRFGMSSIVQRIYIYDRSPRIDFETEVEWHERHALLKVAFPVDVRSTRATYEVQFGNVERPTHWNTSWDWARFEVYAHKWADLSEGDYGVSLLNDCKYGHDIRDNVMRLTLLKSPAAPDPHADEGHHQITYSLYPHRGDWRGGTIRQGYELNNPLVYVQTAPHGGVLPRSFSLVGTDRENVVVETIKVAEDSDDLILRCYESHSQRGEVALSFGLPIEDVFECNLLEEERRRLKTHTGSAGFYVTPFQVRTLGARLKREDKS